MVYISYSSLVFKKCSSTYSFSALLPSMHFMVKHAGTLWVIMSNGLWNETHLNPDTKCHYPQTLIPNSAWQVEKGESLTSAMACWGRSGSFCTLLPALPPFPRPIQLEWMSFWRIHVGDDENISMVLERDKVGWPSGDSPTSVISSSCPRV